MHLKEKWLFSMCKTWSVFPHNFVNIITEEKVLWCSKVEVWTVLVWIWGVKEGTQEVHLPQGFFCKRHQNKPMTDRGKEFSLVLLSPSLLQGPNDKTWICTGIWKHKSSGHTAKTVLFPLWLGRPNLAVPW